MFRLVWASILLVSCLFFYPNLILYRMSPTRIILICVRFLHVPGFVSVPHALAYTFIYISTLVTDCLRKCVLGTGVQHEWTSAYAKCIYISCHGLGSSREFTCVRAVSAVLIHKPLRNYPTNRFLKVPVFINRIYFKTFLPIYPSSL